MIVLDKGVVLRGVEIADKVVHHPMADMWANLEVAKAECEDWDLQDILVRLGLS